MQPFELQLSGTEQESYIRGGQDMKERGSWGGQLSISRLNSMDVALFNIYLSLLCKMMGGPRPPKAITGSVPDNCC